jgi:TPR repeat protein
MKFSYFIAAGFTAILLQSTALSAASLKETLTKYQLTEKDIKGQTALGLKLIKGEGVTKDVESGLVLLEAAASKYQWAKITLANLLIAGKDIPKDLPRGLAILEELASKDDKPALLALANLYLDGIAAPADPVKARSYLDKGVALGDLAAQTKLGTALVKGQGLPQDKAAGAALLQTASAKYEWAKITLGNMLLAGIDLPKDVPQGINLLEGAATLKNTTAMSNLATLYLNGIVVPADPIKARSYLDNARNLGDMGAQLKLATALLKGQGLTQDVESGRTLLEATASRYVWGKITLGNTLVAGIDLPKDFTRGVALLEEAANESNTNALSNLATIYLDGKAISADPIKARSYFDKAIALGDLGAQTKLATALIKGEGLPKDKVEGQKLLEGAAEKYEWAKITLGNMLVSGIELPKDVARGIGYLEQASANKNSSALSNLASIYLDGKVTIVDPLKARSYFEQAIALGDFGAQTKLANALIKGEGLPKDTEGGLKLLEVASRNYIWAKTSLASQLISGVDIQKNVTRGISLYEEAAKTGNSSALTALATLYADGTAVGADPIKARDYFDRAVALGDVGAQTKLATALIKGQGLPKDVVKGEALLSDASNKYVWAKIGLGNILVTGLDLPRDTARGLSLLEQAANENNATAIAALGNIYLDGSSLPADDKKARDYLEKAVALGDTGAKIKLANALITGQGQKKNTKIGLTLLNEAADINIGAKLTLAKYHLTGDFIKQNIPLATNLYESVAAQGKPVAWEILGNFYLYNKTIKRHEALAVTYLTKAGNAGLASSWAALAGGVYGKSLPHSKFDFGYYAKKARAAKNPTIEIYDAYRNMWGVGVPRSKKRAVAILERASAQGNVPTIRLLIQLNRNGMAPIFAKNPKIAMNYLQKYQSKLSKDVIEVENFLMRIASVSNIDAYKKLLNSPENQSFFKRPDVQSQIFATNRRFMVYRAQAGLKRGGIFKGPLDGRATKATFSSMNAACKVLGNCGPIKLTADNLFHMANKW